MDSIEYVFIDDCSTDGSVAALRTIMNKYPDRAENSTIISNKSNQGQAKCRIAGIKNVRGKYVIFCDSDDFVACNAYHDMYNYVEQTNNDIVACNFLSRLQQYAKYRTIFGK